MTPTLSASKVAERYSTALAELQFNSKPVINVLSILAEENADFASMIVAVIEKQLISALPTQKLPILYLMDSIMKNTKNPAYIKHFEKDIVQLFSAVFAKADLKMRADMYKLRCTWNRTFSDRVLHLLDLRVKAMDPAWPVKLSADSTKPVTFTQKKPEINNNVVKPVFSVATPTSPKAVTIKPAAAPPVVCEPSYSSVVERPIDPRKLKRSANDPSAPLPLTLRNGSPEQAETELPLSQSPVTKKAKLSSSECENEELLPSLFADKDQDMRFLFRPQPAFRSIEGRHSPFVSTSLAPANTSPRNESQEDDVSVESSIATEGQLPSKPVITVKHVLQNLLRSNSPSFSLSSTKTGALGSRTGGSVARVPTPTISQPLAPPNPEQLLKFNIGQMCVHVYRRNELVIAALHPVGKRCSTCGIRLTEDDKEAYSAHLDWHFRQNLLKHKNPMRSWFLVIDAWESYRVESPEDNVTTERNPNVSTALHSSAKQPIHASG